MRLGETMGILVAVGFLAASLFMVAADDGHEAVALPAIDFDGAIPELDGPVSYYMNKCARCHGPADDAYAEFAKPHRGEDLKQWIVAMAEGPAIAPLDPAGLALQFELHNAMLDHAPYAWIDESQRQGLAGETIDGTTIHLRTETQRIQAKIADQKFILPRQPGTLVVERNGKTIEIPVGR